ncbi:MAG: UDP-N-acetylglucosamine 2-epimerase (non-hydrolyzing) [bacterium]|nr:UDP-N-acetylglucosamine 2-epimerase (non-hydrolyzing) [bacterium]
MKKIILVAAARPNFMKIGPVVRELKRYPDLFESIIVHTGQHYDKNMSHTFFEQLNIPLADINLGVGSGSHAWQTAEVMKRFEEVVLKERPDLVVVAGDVNSTMGCSIVAAKLHVPVAHIEAGLRSFDRRMPEEINRLVTDAVADILYTPSQDADRQLLKEGAVKEKIVFVGNVMIDTLENQLKEVKVARFYKDIGLVKGNYVLLTLHRPSNVDIEKVFSGIWGVIDKISQDTKVIFPIHPRTRKKVSEFGFRYKSFSNSIEEGVINLLDPLGYNEMLSLTMNAGMVLTDSGGLQEETSYLDVPCITIRDNTERPVTVTNGTNYLAGTDPENIYRAYKNIINGNNKRKQELKYWDGKAAHRIVEHLKQFLFI